MRNMTANKKQNFNCPCSLSIPPPSLYLSLSLSVLSLSLSGLSSDVVFLVFVLLALGACFGCTRLLLLHQCPIALCG